MLLVLLGARGGGEGEGPFLISLFILFLDSYRGLPLASQMTGSGTAACGRLPVRPGGTGSISGPHVGRKWASRGSGWY
jgi:hypothetical protein